MLRLNGVPGSSPSGTGASVVRPQFGQCPAPAFAGAGSAFHPRDHRPDLGQVDLVVAGRQRLRVFAQRGPAIGAARGARGHRLVRVFRQHPTAALAAQAALARTFAFRLVAVVDLLALRRRHAGIVRRLRRSAKPRLQVRDPRRQCPDLRRERLNLRPQRPDQRVFLVMRQGAEVGKIGHPNLESWAPWSRQPLCQPLPPMPSRRGMSRYKLSYVEQSFVKYIVALTC